ncbi:MAG TPA: hypothetical protein VFS48_03000 [Solirubrobacterales bacterium]|nr:hypothetical protein [Solirubrobacterales bacterium]
MPFWASISILGLVQAALVALPVPRQRPAWIGRLSSSWWALVPALSIAVVIGAIEISPGSADALTYIALAAVPPLAAYALAALTRVRVSPPYTRVQADSRSGGAGWLAPVSVVVALFVLAWASPHSLAGEAAATALSGLGCVTLGWLLVCVVAAPWLRLGVYAMAAIDVCFVAADLLQGPNAVLSAAAPAADLPRLQAVHFGSALMGFGDLFVAALVGCLLAAEPALPSASQRRPLNWQLVAAALVAALALCFDLLFFAVDQLPATVPVALALALVQWRRAAGVSDGNQAVSGPG